MKSFKDLAADVNPQRVKKLLVPWLLIYIPYLRCYTCPLDMAHQTCPFQHNYLFLLGGFKPNLQPYLSSLIFFLIFNLVEELYREMNEKESKGFF
jgi:hypothetical protein